MDSKYKTEIQAFQTTIDSCAGCEPHGVPCRYKV